jgi:hypothetical protein
MKSRLAAIPLGYNQPQTHPRVGTKKLGRSHVVLVLLWPGLKLGELVGAGHPVNDLHGSLVTVLVDTLVYGTAMFLILLLATKR